MIGSLQNIAEVMRPHSVPDDSDGVYQELRIHPTTQPRSFMLFLPDRP